MANTTARTPTTRCGMITLSFEDAKARYVHRFTMQHVPAWSQYARSDGKYYAPQYRTDREWYENTYFKGEHEVADDSHCYSTNPSWPLGGALASPFIQE